MKLINKGKFELSIGSEESVADFQTLLNKRDRNFEYSLSISGTESDGQGLRGDDAIWIPFSSTRGLKIYAENPKYASLEESLDTVEVIHGFPSVLFPIIHDYGLFTDEVSKNKFVYIEMENMGKPTSQEAHNATSINFVDKTHRETTALALWSDMSVNNAIAQELSELDLSPEDEWYKKINCINGKIVDFHRFQIKPQRYNLPAHDTSTSRMKAIYNNMVSRYKSVLDGSGLPKWKGKIYQGFNFDNGYTMQGYTSDSRIFDSYKKLPFIPMNKGRGKNVLDLGSNQGFFCFQASLHGAKHVTGVELQEQDHLAALDIKEITDLKNVDFENTNAVDFMEGTEKRYGLIIMNSVLHQIYANFDNSGRFMENISQKCDYFAFETPMNHPLMNISPNQVYSELNKYFKNVRLLNVYDAYSSGYRANYVCFH